MPEGLFLALAGAFKLLQPGVDKHYAEKSNQDHLDRLAEFSSIAAMPDCENRAVRLGDFIGRLRVAAGDTSGELSGRTIKIPVEDFLFLVRATSGNIRDTEHIAALEFKKP